MGPRYIADVKQSRLTISIGGKQIGAAEFRASGWQTLRFPLPEAPSGAVRVEFAVEPEYRPSASDPRLLGIPLGSFGFVAGTAAAP